MTISVNLKYLMLRLAVFLLNQIPLGVLSVFAKGSVSILSRALRKERGIALSQLSFALPETDHEEIFRESLYSAIMTALEGFRIRKLLAYTQTGNKKKTTKPSVDFKVNGLDILDSISRRGDAAVCLTAHIGNFELMAAFFSVRGYPMTVIARKANSPVIQKLLSKIRTGYGLQMLWREDADTSRLLIRAIKDKRYICALIDQDIALENGFTPFFGLEAAHPISPVRIAVRFKKPVLFWNTFRKSCSEHHISVSQIHWEDKDNPEQYILSEYARLTELKIRENPGQWVWWHRRWRRRPGTDYEKEPHKLVSSKDYIEWMRQMGEEKLFSEHSPCS